MPYEWHFLYICTQNKDRANKSKYTKRRHFSSNSFMFLVILYIQPCDNRNPKNHYVKTLNFS